jgi:hypothetical protein
MNCEMGWVGVLIVDGGIFGDMEGLWVIRMDCGWSMDCGWYGWIVGDMDELNMDGMDGVLPRMGGLLGLVRVRELERRQ